MLRISASALDTFMFCPLYYKAIYVDKSVKRWPSNAYIEFWSSIHEALAYNYRQKITSRVDLPIKEILEFFWNDLTRRVTDLHSPRDMALLPNLILEWEEMLYQYMNKIWQYLQPKLVEHEFTLEIKSAWVLIHWFIDLVTEDDIIIDHKTCWATTYQKWTQNHVTNMHQLTMYSLAFRKMFLYRENGLHIDVLKRLKSWPSFDRIETTRSDWDIIALVQLLKRCADIVNWNLFYPNLLACKECDLRDSCTKLSW